MSHPSHSAAWSEYIVAEGKGTVGNLIMKSSTLHWVSSQKARCKIGSIQLRATSTTISPAVPDINLSTPKNETLEFFLLLDCLVSLYPLWWSLATVLNLLAGRSLLVKIPITACIDRELLWLLAHSLFVQGSQAQNSASVRKAGKLAEAIQSLEFQIFFFLLASIRYEWQEDWSMIINKLPPPATYLYVVCFLLR